MKNAIITALITCLSLTGFAQQTPVKINGKLHVAQGQILNRHGNPPELRGVSLSWSVWGGRKYFNTDAVDWLCKDFNISLIRASMAVQPNNGYLQKPDDQKKLITTVVDRAIKNGIYVLIDWHDHNGNLHVAQSKNFFGEMAKKYKGVPNVIYEIWNEPERVTWDTVKNYVLQIIPEIRRYDKDNLIVVGSPHWDQDVDLAAADPIKGYTNIAYSFHFYASDSGHQAGLRTRADKAIQSGLPLMVTEWGVGEANGNGVFDLEKNATWLKWMQDHKLSWANWNITDKKETTAILQPGAPAIGGWTEQQLTPAGIYIRNVLRELNK